MNVFKTPDLYLFAYLIVKGYKVHSVVKERKRCVFHIEDREGRPQDVRDFHNNAPVGVSSYRGALQSVRAMIRDMSVPNYRDWSNYRDVKK